MTYSKSSPRVIVRTKYQLSLSNPDNKRINKTKAYTNNMLDYYSDIEKKAINLIDYYTGKINKNMDINLVLENGKYATIEELEKRKKYIGNQINYSNLWQVVVSFDNSFVDNNISLEDLEQKMAKEIIPSFLKKMGFEDIKKMQYEFSLHTNTDNYHFHIAFLEKEPNTKNSNNKLVYRRIGKIPRNCINYLKNETILSIERDHEFKPRAIVINKDIEDIKEYFKINSYNNVLKNNKYFYLEEKILRLGKLLDEKYNTDNKRIKYNSIKDKEIKTLTKEIKKDLFTNNSDLNISLKEFNKSISDMNSYLKKVAVENNISKEDIDLIYTKNKEEYLDNYILNAIVNQAKYNYKSSKDYFSISSDDVIKTIIYEKYKKKRYTKKDIINNYYKSNGEISLKNDISKSIYKLSNDMKNTSRIKSSVYSFFKNYKLEKDINNAVRNINRELDESVEEFHKLFVVGDDYIK